MRGGTQSANETELLARAVLQAANKTQARDTSIRLVVPRDPVVTRELGSEGIAEWRVLAAEEWLLHRDYLAPANVGLTWGTYTITPAGLDWLKRATPRSPEAPKEEAPGYLPHPDAEEPQHVPGRPWWKRVLSG